MFPGISIPLYYVCCNVSIAPVRTEPSHRAEQSTQLLFGERAAVLEESGDGWVRLLISHDHYVGWCRASQTEVITKKAFEAPRKTLAGGKTDLLRFEDGSSMWLPAGACLSGMKNTAMGSSENAIRFKGKKVHLREARPEEASIQHWLRHYLHAPYLWGGRSRAGIDCSGLVQQVFALCGANLRRDACQQAEGGVAVDFLQEARCGDLAFFDNAEGRITHVGVLLDSQTIVHGTEYAGRVVQDKIDSGGIISSLLKKRTHQLRLIRRMV